MPTTLDLSSLNPGIRRTVQGLRRQGFETCDSGDGATHAHPCDRPYPYVVMRVEADELVNEAGRLVGMLRLGGLEVVTLTRAFAESECPAGVCIQASYDPADSALATLDLMGLSDAILPSRWPG